MPYDPASLSSLRQSISEPRLRHYLDRFEGQEDFAIRQYMWNVELSSSFWGPLSLLEVTLRNRIQDRLLPYHVNTAWFASRLTSTERRIFQEAIDSLDREGISNPTDDDIVAKLSFGFWVSLLDVGLPRDRLQNHEVALWRPYLHKAFPNMPTDATGIPKRRDAHRQLDSIRKFRNRIAHHEPIWRSQHRAMLDSILTTASYLDAEMASFMQLAHRVDATIDRREDAVRKGNCVI